MLSNILVIHINIFKKCGPSKDYILLRQDVLLMHPHWFQYLQGIINDDDILSKTSNEYCTLNSFNS